MGTLALRGWLTAWCYGEVVAGPLSPRVSDALVFTGEMYGLQVDQLAAVLDATERGASAAVARWRRAGLAEAARLGPGPRWVWLTRPGLRACGLPYAPSVPALSRLAHLRAVTAVRLALAATEPFGAAGAHWRSERRIRARISGRTALREHVPDGEVHWPDAGDLAWAGECWAVEAELSAKTLTRTVAIMREVLSRTGDYGCRAAEVRVPWRPPRHARVLYLCSPAARPVVTRARSELGPLAARVEIRPLPEAARWPGVGAKSAVG